MKKNSKNNKGVRRVTKKKLFFKKKFKYFKIYERIF